MGRDIRIEEAKNGYILREWKPSKDNDVYQDDVVDVAENKESVLEKVKKWLDKE